MSAPAASGSSGRHKRARSPSPSPSDSATSAAQRRIATRHWDEGPRPHAEAEAVAEAVADGSQQPPPPRVHLYANALQSIFVFLSLRELAFALRVSRGWQTAVTSMRRMDLTVDEPAAPLSVVARSSMGRHVAEVGWDYRRVKISPADLSLVAERMAHLRALQCQLRVAPPPDEPLRFPAQLQTLDIEMRRVTDTAQLNAAIAAISRLPLLDHLTVRVDAIRPQISFAPLAVMPKLRTLVFHSWWQVLLSDAQIDQLRAMPHLREVHVDLTTDVLRRLLRQPHDLQWQQMLLPHEMDDEAAALLPQLPSLTKIDQSVQGIACQRFDWLRGLPNLTDVELRFDGAEIAEGRAASLVAGLQCCTNIQILGFLRCADLTSAQLAELLPRLPRLRELELAGLRIDSLAFLAQPSLTISLRRLLLHRCSDLPPSELVHVHALRGLTKLELLLSFDAPLDSVTVAQLAPPSAVLPQLKEFSYFAPDPPEPPPPAAAEDDADGGDADGGGDGDQPAEEADESDSHSDSDSVSAGDAAAAGAADIDGSDAEAE